jgi:hypothetical protein
LEPSPNGLTTWNKVLPVAFAITEFARVANHAGLRIIQKAVRRNKQSERFEVEGLAQGDDRVIVVRPVSILGPTLHRAFGDHESVTEWCNLVHIEWRDGAIESGYRPDACRPAALIAFENTVAGRQHMLATDQTAGAAMSFSGWGIWKFDH